MLFFPEFLCTFKLKNEATNTIKILQVLRKIGLDHQVGTYKRDDVFSTISGIINLHPIKGTHWVRYKGKYYSDS